MKPADRRESQDQRRSNPRRIIHQLRPIGLDGLTVRSTGFELKLLVVLGQTREPLVPLRPKRVPEILLVVVGEVGGTNKFVPDSTDKAVAPIGASTNVHGVAERFSGDRAKGLLVGGTTHETIGVVVGESISERHRLMRERTRKMKAADRRPSMAEPSEPAIRGTRSGAPTQAPPAMRQRSAGSERQRKRQQQPANRREGSERKSEANEERGGKEHNHRKQNKEHTTKHPRIRG